MDILDILQGRYHQLHAGRYYDRLPHTNQTYKEPILFEFEYVDPSSWSYRQLIANLVDTEAADVSIKTKDKFFKVGKYITIEGKLYKIVSVLQDHSSAARESAAFLPIPVGIDYVIRLVEMENPWGLI